MQNKAPARPWYAHRWPWLLMLGPAVVVAAGVVTMWLAFAHQDALVVDDYYKEGRAINKDLRRDAEAARLKMALRLNYNAAEGRLAGMLESPAGAGTQELDLRLIHPTLPQDDIDLKLHVDDAGRFDVALPLLPIGHWRVQAEDQQQNWRLTGVWAWPQQRQIELKADADAAG